MQILLPESFVVLQHTREPPQPFSASDQSCVSGEDYKTGQYNRWQQKKSTWVQRITPYLFVPSSKISGGFEPCLQMKSRKCPVLHRYTSESHRWWLLGDLRPGQVYLVGNVLSDGLSRAVKGLGNQIAWLSSLLLLEARGEGFLSLPWRAVIKLPWLLSAALGREVESWVVSLQSSVISWSWAFSGTRLSLGLEKGNVSLGSSRLFSGYDRWLNCLLAAVCLTDPQELSTGIISALIGNGFHRELMGLLLGCCSWAGSCTPGQWKGLVILGIWV